ncbi:MAG: AraC family transcriptional regulator [Methylomonas sp.]|jgi:AraC-like DNA-binding protein|uniref:helix-turn-helix transcriptional regulator n=1 Tax=Methylomonas sp. TaxID=418 RepID=UPI0025E84189|nr:AraC family transcriptional regulator [Methylomonas sp.]MCK9607926.1 AraC family transcriptional regulator [Methylomonas sp.]
MQINSSSLWRIDPADAQWQAASEPNGLIQALPDSIGFCQSKMFKLDADLNYIETRYNPKRHIAICSRMPPQAPRMVLTLGLSGGSRFENRQGNLINFKSGYSTITTFNASEGSRQYQGDQVVTQLRFSMTQAWLEQYFGEGAFTACFKQNALQLVSQRPSAAATLLAARGLLQNSLPANAQPLFRQGQTMAIVANELGCLLSATEVQSTRLSAQEKRFAELARDILCTEYKNPPSVAELSKRVGTNPFKLKQLFHRHFNSTPYGLLLEIRMENAYRLLTSQHYPVGMAAEAVGYQYPGNFSAAFTKYFGFPPKQLSRRS